MQLDVNLKNLVRRLDRTCTEALRAAVHLCTSRTHRSVEVEHLLAALVERDDTDLTPILRQSGIAPSELRAAIERRFRSIDSGYHETPTFSSRLVQWLQSAWLVASVDFGAPTIRSGHLFLALLADEDLEGRARGLAPELKDIRVSDLRDLFEQLVARSPESLEGTGGVAAQAPSAAGAPPVTQGTPALEQFSIDLTAEARSGKMDPIIGRDGEIRKMIDILLRRRKNNPIVVGDPGVGKTAVVEGLALRIAEGDVPDKLKNVTLRTLDLALLQAGAGVRGEFENRLKEVIKEVKSSPSPIILFIDEAHTLIGAGGGAGQGDAANLLKPALARGELRTIAATTHAEYKKYFEKDAALERRFQPIVVDEPSLPAAIQMMRAVAPKMEAHHRVRILDEAVHAAVEMGARYISGRNLPDKSVDLLDTACARVALAQAALPEPLEDCRRRLADIDREIGVLERETALGDADHQAALTELRARRAAVEGELQEVTRAFEQARGVMQRILPLRLLIEARAAGKEPPEGTAAEWLALDDAGLKAELARLKADLARLQGERALVAICADAEMVAQVVSAWTGIPVGRMVRDEIEAIQRLQGEMEKRVVGQSPALEEIAKRIQTSRAGLEDPNKPIGVFLLSGSSGVGKTEAALALAEILYGGERNLTVINMSEYQEGHSVSNLKGSPKGYVGYGEGGVLTEAVRQKPYCVVLLDEIEKAHRDVIELFYQVFDKGMLEDSTGRVVNFRNTVILMTSNLGGDEIVRAQMKHEGEPLTAQQLREIALPKLRAHFPAAFLGRTIVLPFGSLGDDVMAQITRLKLNKVANRMRDEHGVALTWDDEVVEEIVYRCVEVESGARNIDHIVTNTLLPDLARRILGWLVDGTLPQAVRIALTKGGAFAYLRDGEALPPEPDEQPGPVAQSPEPGPPAGETPAPTQS